MIFFSNCIIAQPPAGTTIYHSEFSKFTGKWQWVSNLDTITLRLNKENVIIPGFNFGGEDYIIGFHQVKHGNIIIESSLQYYPQSAMLGNFTICGSWPLFGNNKTLRVRAKDISKDKDDSFELTLNSDNTQLSLKRVFLAGGLRFGPMPAPGFTIPDSIVFNKIVPPPLNDN